MKIVKIGINTTRGPYQQSRVYRTLYKILRKNATTLPFKNMSPFNYKRIKLLMIS